jgi:glycosyltransferase involved in cell wall biosynthesis
MCNGERAAQAACHASADASRYVEELLAHGWFDLVHVEGFYLAQHVPRACSVPVLLVEQNVEYELWRQRMEHADEETQRRALFLQYRLTRDEEVRAWRAASVCATLTDDDRRTIKRVAPELDVRVVPDGADHLAPPVAASDDRTVVMVGNFAYQPTADGAIWFCSEILPHLVRRVPDVRVLLVGTDPTPDVRAQAGGRVTVTGRVPRVEPYLDRAAVVVCPLRVGGGVKVKVLEALCRGKAVVTTRVGVQGLGEAAADAVVLADDIDGFAAAVAGLLQEPRRRRALGRAARSFAATLPTWDDAAAALRTTYRELTATAEREPVLS